MSAIINFLAQRILENKAEYKAVIAKYPKAAVDEALQREQELEAKMQERNTPHA